jgi:membrane protein implicated in regulation of membrane protease activity
MRIGGMLWFVAGFAFCLLFLNDGLGGLFSFVATALGNIVTFVLTLGGFAGGGALGAVAVLALIGVALLVGRTWAERARGAYDANEAFERRRNYRTK